MRRTIAVLLAAVFILTLIPVLPSSAALTTVDIENNMNYYKSNVYQDGTYWCGGNVNVSVSHSICGKKYDCLCNCFAGAYQCHGFALCLASKVVGSYPAGSLSSYYHGKKSNGWTCYTKSALGTQGIVALGLQPGDIVRASSDASFQDGHTAVVWKLDGDTVYFAECWGSVYSKICWGGFNYRSYSMSQICSRYSYVALWRNDSVILTHNTSCYHTYVQKYEDAHPHAGYMVCTKCGDRYYNNTNTQKSDCACCKGTHSYILKYETAHPHATYNQCTVCGNTVYTGEYTKSPTCVYCNTVPYNLSISTAKTSYHIGEEIVINLSAYEAKEMKIEIYRDGFLYRTLPVAGISMVFSPIDTGTYYAKLYATNDNGDATPVISNTFTVDTSLAGLESSGEYVYMLFMNPLSEDELKEFCDIRGVDIALYNANTKLIDSLCERYPDLCFAVRRTDSSLTYVGKGINYGGFVAELNIRTQKKVCGKLNGTSYTVFPYSLPFSEAKAVSDEIGIPLASISNDEENSLVASLIAKSGLRGAFIGATDEAKEGVWQWLNGKKFEYTNWSISYLGFSNTSNNFLYMYKDGTWIDSASSPISSSGFVCSEYLPFTYSVISKGTVSLTGFADKASTVTVPEKVDGYTVTSISQSAFSGMKLTSVSIPDSVTHIDKDTFSYCPDVTILCTLGSYAYSFAKAQKLKYSIILPFTDVESDSWYTQAVKFCYENSLMSGTSATEFSSSTQITRAMFVTVLSKMDCADTSAYKSSTSFSDVPLGQWYSQSIEWAYKNGYAAGDGAYFRPNSPVTREQLAVFLYAYSEKNGLDTDNLSDLSRFDDCGKISSWAYTALSWAVGNGLISGTSATTVSPSATATRAQNAVIIQNFMRNFLDM